MYSGNFTSKGELLSTATLKYNVYHLPLPQGIYGFVTYKESTAEYTIYINSDKTEAEQIKAYIHEYNHIVSGHLTSNISVCRAETETKEKIIELIEQLQLIKN